MEKNKMILYEDRDIIVCHKPEGIPVQSARIGQKDMVSILNNYLAGTGMVYVVHRLDQPVEGVLVFAKTKKAASGLTRQITEGSMEKVYHAVCLVTEKARENYGWMIGDKSQVEVKEPDSEENSQNAGKDPAAEENGQMKNSDSAEGQMQTEKRCAAGQEYHLTDYLIKDGRTNTSRIVSKGQKDAKEARLSFRVLDLRENCLLAEIHLDTGRHHQIRVQMAHAGLPLMGDRKYNEKWEDAAGSTELALCAVSLTFRHPINRKKMKFEVVPKKQVFRMEAHADKSRRDLCS